MFYFRIQIGVPKERNPFQENKRTGVVLRCGIKEPCRYVRLRIGKQLGRNIVILFYTLIITYLDETIKVVDGAFFGNSMDISEDKKTFVVSY